MRAAVGRPLTDALRDLTAAEFGPDGGKDDWQRATGLGHLTDACAPMSGPHQPPSPPEAAALRAVALALTSGASGATSGGGEVAADGVLRTVAATVTLVEDRGRGRATAGESIILALR